MRCQEVRATKAILMLKELGIKSAESATLEEACQLWGRVQRAAYSQKPCWRTSQAKRRRLRRRAGY